MTSELVNDAEYVGEVAVEFDRPGDRAFVHPKIPSSEEPRLLIQYSEPLAPS